MFEFASLEYMKEVQRRSNADQKYRDLSKEETASYLFILEPEPEKGVTKRFIIGYIVVRGEIVDVWVDEPRKTDFVISGKYGVWVDILLGKLGVTRAFLMRKLKVRGNFLKLMKYQKSTERWLEILRTIPTRFHGEYEKFNIEGKEYESGSL